ncbi:MAG: hypothetical protein LC126_24715 [Bryobacterales bacterium]|nr:hypothetical protein [Bryobacterales bacterium]
MGDIRRTRQQRAGGAADRERALGRIHYLAFSLRRTSIAYFPHNDRPVQPYNGFQPGRANPAGARGDSGPQLPESQRLPHLRQGLDNLKRAIELDPGNGLYELGLACLYEDAASFAAANRLLADLQAARPPAFRNGHVVDVLDERISGAGRFGRQPGRLAAGKRTRRARAVV